MFVAIVGKCIKKGDSVHVLLGPRSVKDHSILSSDSCEPLHYCARCVLPLWWYQKELEVLSPQAIGSSLGLSRWATHNRTLTLMGMSILVILFLWWWPPPPKSLRSRPVAYKRAWVSSSISRSHDLIDSCYYHLLQKKACSEAATPSCSQAPGSCSLGPKWKKMGCSCPIRNCYFCFPLQNVFKTCAPFEQDPYVKKTEWKSCVYNPVPEPQFLFSEDCKTPFGSLACFCCVYPRTC